MDAIKKVCSEIRTTLYDTFLLSKEEKTQRELEPIIKFIKEYVENNRAIFYRTYKSDKIVLYIWEHIDLGFVMPDKVGNAIVEVIYHKIPEDKDYVFEIKNLANNQKLLNERLTATYFFKWNGFSKQVELRYGYGDYVDKEITIIDGCVNIVFCKPYSEPDTCFNLMAYIKSISIPMFAKKIKITIKHTGYDSFK